MTLSVFQLWNSDCIAKVEKYNKNNGNFSKSEQETFICLAFYLSPNRRVIFLVRLTNYTLIRHMNNDHPTIKYTFRGRNNDRSSDVTDQI